MIACRCVIWNIYTTSPLGRKNLISIIGRWTCITQKLEMRYIYVLLYTHSGANDMYEFFPVQQQQHTMWSLCIKFHQLSMISISSQYLDNWQCQAPMYHIHSVSSDAWLWCVIQCIVHFVSPSDWLWRQHVQNGGSIKLCNFIFDAMKKDTNGVIFNDMTLKWREKTVFTDIES